MYALLGLYFAILGIAMMLCRKLQVALKEKEVMVNHNQFFRDLLTNHLGNEVRIIVWDLDGCLGDFPGWNGPEHMPLHAYVQRPEKLRALLQYLKTLGIEQNVLVSRNGMFCHDTFTATSDLMMRYGFDDIIECHRLQGTSKVSRVCAGLACTKRTLLIDDQRAEIEQANRDGAYGLQVHQALFKAIDDGTFTLYGPGHRPLWVGPGS